MKGNKRKKNVNQVKNHWQNKKLRQIGHELLKTANTVRARNLLLK